MIMIEKGVSEIPQRICGKWEDDGDREMDNSEI